jgi:hypothetical protein
MIVVTLGGVNSRHAKTVTHPASRAGEVINALIDASIATITMKGG